MGIFTENEEEFKKKANIELYNKLRAKGLEPNEIAKIIGTDAAREGYDAQNGWDGHWAGWRYIKGGLENN
jgi:hypothetical protein